MVVLADFRKLEMQSDRPMVVVRLQAAGTFGRIPPDSRASSMNCRIFRNKGRSNAQRLGPQTGWNRVHGAGAA
jgi:hypothetical protein